MTTPENQNTMQEQELEPFFPPIVLFAISAIGFFVALAVFLTQTEFNIVGWAGLLVGIIAFIFWMVMNPKAVMDFVRGRGAVLGGTAIIVSIVLVVAAVLIYMVVDAQNWTLDYTQGNVLTIADNTRDVLETLASDPTTGNVHFVAFVNQEAIAGQERMELLFAQFEDVTNGKISYEFVDPDREPNIAQQYGENVRNGQVAVVAYDADGNLILDDVELLTNPDQYALTNMTIEVLAAGDFRAIFVNVPEGSDPNDNSPQGTGSSTWVTYLRDVLGWTVEIISPLELTTQAGLGEMVADGDVLIIAGGIDALPDEAITTIAEYVNNGGNLVLLAGSNLAPEPTLAAADNMTAFLQETYGVSVRNDVVVDDEEHFSLQGLQLIAENYNSHSITGPAVESDLFTFFSIGQSIEVAATAPDGVVVTTLVTTTENAYAKEGLDINALFAQENVTLEQAQALFAQAESDISGVLPLAVAVDNTANGSRLVVFGSDAMIWNAVDGSQGEANPFLMQGAIFWTTRFDEFAAALAFVQPVEEVPPDEVLLTATDVDYIRFVTVILIPFGSLLVGVAVWWIRRERMTA